MDSASPGHSVLVPARGTITYSAEYGHVCSCSRIDVPGEQRARYVFTVASDDSVAPTDSGSWWYTCSSCGAGAWSGCRPCRPAP